MCNINYGTTFAGWICNECGAGGLTTITFINNRYLCTVCLNRLYPPSNMEVRTTIVPPPVCTGTGTVPTDMMPLASNHPIEGRCGICGQMVKILGGQLVTHPYHVVSVG